MTYVYVPYPRAMYLGGEVKPENRIVVESELEEVESRKRGYLKAYEKPMESLVATDAVMDMLKAKESAPAPVPAPAKPAAKPKKK